MKFWQAEIAVYEITLQTVDRVSLPPEKGSTLDGAIDNAFYAAACRKKKEKCPCSSTCPYAVVFKTEGVVREKVDGNKELRRYRNPPKAYLIEPPPERKSIFQPGELLSFRLFLFGKVIRYFPYFIVALQALEQIGIGKGRGKVELVEVQSLHPLYGTKKPIYLRDSETGLLPNESLLIDEEDFEKKAQEFSDNKIMLELLTPTRIKMKGAWLNKLTFVQLMIAILRRAKLLSNLYGKGVSDESWKELLKESASVKLKQENFAWYDWGRYSRRHHKKIMMGGIVGRATYTGETLSQFMPYLLLGQFIHIGKGYIYGMGKYMTFDRNGEVIWNV